jgi:hypothetical protein
MAIEADSKNIITVDASISSLPTTPTDGTDSIDLGDIKMINCIVEVVSLDLPTVNLRLKLNMSHVSANKEVKFPFDFERDTVGAVVEEMVKEHVLQVADGEIVAASIRDTIKDPLVMYEMARANAPARAEMNESVTSPVSVPTCGSAVTLTTDTVSEAQSAISSVNSQNQEKSELSESDLDILIQDHPEVATLLLRQKKEIDLLALFHRREYQALLKSLKRQIGSRSRNDSQSNGILGRPTPTMSNGTVQLGDLDEPQFISKARHLMYESTGNSVWLPEGAAPNTGSNLLEH